MNLGTLGPGIKGGSDLLLWVKLMNLKVTFTMKRAILLIKITMTAICARMPDLCIPRIFGLARMQKSSLAVEFILSEAGLSALSF